MTTALVPSRFREAQEGDEEHAANESQARRQRNVLAQVYALYTPLVRQAHREGSVSFTVSGKEVPAPRYLGEAVREGDDELLNALSVHRAISAGVRAGLAVFTLVVREDSYTVYGEVARRIF